MEKDNPSLFQRWKTEFKWKIFYWCIALIGLFSLLSDLLLKIALAVFVIPILSYCPNQAAKGDFISITFFISAIIYLISKFKKKLLPTPNSLLFFTTVIMMYLAIRFNNFFTYYSFKFFNKLYYADFFVFSFLIYLVNYKSYQPPLTVNTSSISFLEDSPNENHPDEYDRNGYASTLVEHINQTHTDNSFSIGIVGEWGSGKTDFILRLKKSLEGHNNIVFDFNPWRVSKPEAIVEEFFQTLSTKLKPYNHSILSNIKDYSKRILQAGKEIQYRMIDTILQEWISDVNIQQQYDNINTAIKATGKRLIVCIDDLDRLTGREVMEVLRIIRNTANFANTFFITGIDPKYIGTTLKKTGDFLNEGEYLRKFFQLTVTLPSFKKDVLTKLCKKILITDDLSEKDKSTLANVINKLSYDFSDVSAIFYPAIPPENILEKLIDNIRDLKRFCNSFKIAYHLLKNETDIHDLFVLELIRNRNIEVYNLIRNRSLVGFDINHGDSFLLKKEAWAKFEQKNKESIEENEMRNIKEAVEYLISDEIYKNARKFQHVHNFYLYFSYKLFDLISFIEFNSVIESDLNNILSRFEEWLAEGKQGELFRITNKLIEFPNIESLQKINKVYLRVNPSHGHWLLCSKRLIFGMRTYNHERYFKKDKSLHKDFLQNIMSDKSINPYNRASVATLFLKEIIERKSEPNALVLSKKEWQKIMYGLFDEYLNIIDNLSFVSLQFFAFNDDQRDKQGNVILYLPACRRFRNSITSNIVFFENYVGMLIRPSDGHLVLDPLLEQIFQNWKIFKMELEKVYFHRLEINRLKAIALEYLEDFYTNDHKPFIISKKDDTTFIENWMRDIGILNAPDLASWRDNI